MKPKRTLYVSVILVLGICLTRSVDAGASLFIDPMFAVKVTNDVVYTTAQVQSPTPGEKSLLLDLYEPEGNSASRLRPGFVVIHGGGLARGDKRTENMVELCREFAARGYLCVSINYRLVPDDPPGKGNSAFERTLNAAISDAWRAVAWLRKNASRYRLDPNRIAVGGSSAGAAIALRLVYGETSPRVRVSAVLSWVGGLDGNEGILDPGEPPLYIVHGAEDDSVPVSEAYALAKHARRAVIPCEITVCEGLGHNVPLDRRPAGVSLYHRIARFFYEHLDLSHLGQRFTPPQRKKSNEKTDILSIQCPK